MDEHGGNARQSGVCTELRREIRRASDGVHRIGVHIGAASGECYFRSRLNRFGCHPEALAATSNFETVLGGFSYDAVGDAQYDPVVLVVRDGELLPF